MNTKAIKGLTAGVLALGVAATLAGSIAPAQAQQGYGRGGDGNGGYGSGRYGNGGYGNGGGHVFRGGRPMPNADWGEIDKTPRFGGRSRPGYYVWRQGDEVFVATNAPNFQGRRRFAGDVTVQGGSISRVEGYRTGRGDRYNQTGPNRVRFSFDTGNDVDGIKFHVDGGRRIVVRLDGFNQDGDRFYLGQDKIGTTVNPLVIEK